LDRERARKEESTLKKEREERGSETKRQKRNRTGE